MKRIDLTDDKTSPVKAIIWLAWPLFLEQILSTLVSFADTAMVGALGVNATASVSISNSFVFLLNGIIIALGTGLTAYVAKNVGAKNYEEAKAYIRHAFILLFIVGLPICLMTAALYRSIPKWMGAEDIIMEDASAYLLITSLFRFFNMTIMVLSSVLRGRGDTKTSFRVNTVINIINIIGNYLLINPTHDLSIGTICLTIPGAGWGVRGAAVSTGISWLIGAVWLSAAVFRIKDPTQISIRDSYKPDRQILKNIIGISIPAMLERFCMSLSSIVVTRCIASLGTVYVAANSVYSNVESISYMPAFAFATAATTLVGQCLGAQKPDRAVYYTKLTNLIGISVMILAGVGLYVFADPLVRIITPDEDAVIIARQCLRIVAFIQPVQTVAWIYAGALRGAGDTKWPFYITAVCTWSIRALGSYLCIRVFGMGLAEAVICMNIDNACRCVLFHLRFRSNKWQKTLSTRK